MHLYCVFLDQKVKIAITYLNWDGCSKKYSSDLNKIRAGEGVFLSFLPPLFMFLLEFKEHGDAQMCCEMQNNLSNTRASPQRSMG